MEPRFAAMIATELSRLAWRVYRLRRTKHWRELDEFPTLDAGLRRRILAEVAGGPEVTLRWVEEIPAPLRGC